MQMKMFKVFSVCHLPATILTVLVLVSAAPSDNSKSTSQSDTAISDKTLNADILETKNDSEPPSGQRQKRWYNYYGYGFPPVNPVIYPNYVKRDDSASTGFYGAPQDPFVQIHKRLNEISSYVRQPAPQPPVQFPFFFPVIYIPQFGCGCNQGTVRPTQPIRPTNGTTPDILNRFPDMEDPRQNWGIVVDDEPRQSVDDVDYADDGSRPISFNPIRPNRPLSRPSPPVEHGSSQEGATASSSQSFRPGPSSTPRPGPPSTPRPGNVGRPTLTTTTMVPPSAIPNTCDGAVLSCCHQPQVTYDCFVSRGCSDPTSYGSPCDPQVILRVIERFQRYYGQRT